MGLDIDLYIEPEDLDDWQKRFDQDITDLKVNRLDHLIPIIEDYYNECKPENEKLYSCNITHNLTKMADAAGIYEIVWRPEENNITSPSQLIDPLTKAIKDMENRSDYYKQFDASNSWGTYKDFLPWLKCYLNACIKYPNAKIDVSR